MIDYKYPRTMDEAFPGHGDYACALEIPRRAWHGDNHCCHCVCRLGCCAYSMTHEQANVLLNRLKEGIAFPLPAINLALYLTGDLSDKEFANQETSASWGLQNVL